MPKTLTPAMRAHLDAETTRLATIWRITRKDGAQFFFTDHDRDIVLGGEVYRADAGFEPTAIRSNAGFDNGTEIEALAGSNPSFAAREQNEPYTIALLIKGRSGGASTKHLYRSGTSSTGDHILFLI